MKLVLIEWLDSHGSQGWQTLEELEHACEPMKCRSVGWLFREGKDFKTILPHIAGENNKNIILQGRGELTIPTKAITKIKILQEDKK